MFDEKTILARLQAGEDAQTIANEMAAMINNANKMYADQKAKEEEARKAEELKKAQELQKTADLQDILDQITLWFAQYYGIEESLSADEILAMIDEVQGYVNALGDLGKVLAVKPKAKVVKTQNPDETLNAFLNKMGW